MKKILIALFSVLVLSSCGVGSYSTSGGKADEAAISFTSLKATPLVVTIDNDVYHVSSVATSNFKKKKDLKATAANTIRILPGTHDVKVYIDDYEVFSKKIFISTSEQRVIAL